MLATCPDCKKQVSMDAVACPHCGKPRSEGGWAKPAPAGGPIAGLVGLALIGAIVWGVFSLFGGGGKAQSKAPAWVPQIGHRADLKKGFVVCDATPALNAFLSELAKAHPRWPPQTAPLMAGQTAPGRTVGLCLFGGGGNA